MAPPKVSRALLLAATLAICASAASSGNSTAHHDDHDDHDDDHGHHGQFDHFNYATWEQSDHLLAATTRMGCDIIDSRQWHPNDHFGLAHCVNEMYIRDTSLELPTTLDMDEAQEARLQARIDEVYRRVPLSQTLRGRS